LSESTVRTTLKITSAVAAALAFSLAAAGTALADEIGADASGGGTSGLVSVARRCRHRLRRLLFRRPRLQRREGPVLGWIRLWVQLKVGSRPSWASVSRHCLRHLRRLLFRRRRLQRREGPVLGWIRLWFGRGWICDRLGCRSPTLPPPPRRRLCRRLRVGPDKPGVRLLTRESLGVGPVQKDGAHVLAPAQLPRAISYRHSPLIRWVGAQSITMLRPHLPPSGT